MPRILRYSGLIGAIMLIVIGFMPVLPARGNPTPAPNPYTLIGTDFEGTQFQFKWANVTLDVYTEYTEGKGTYVIENLANTSNTLNAYFIAWIQGVNVTAVTCNQTPIAFTVIHPGGCSPTQYLLPSIEWECLRNVIIPIDFIANGTIMLEICWNFPSVDIEESYGFFPEHIQWTTFNTGYVINGGNDWGGIPIEWEDVRFNFHTDAFFSQGRNISVICDCNYYLKYETTVELPLDVHEVPYYLYHAEDINVSTCISMRRVLYYQTEDDVAKSIFYIAVGAAIGIPWCFIKKARKHSVILSVLGLSASLVTYRILRGYIWTQWMIMLTVYLIGASIIIVHYYSSLRPGWHRSTR